MRKSEAVKYYGGVENGAYAKIAGVLGIKRQSVRGWPAVVPPQAAIELEIATKGAIRVNRELYRRRRK